MAQLSVMVGPDSAFPPSRANTVTFVAGRLEHWTGAIPVEGWAQLEREGPGDHSGFYKIGSGGVDVPRDVRSSASADENDEVDVLYVPIDENTGAYILVADDEHAIFGGGRS